MGPLLMAGELIQSQDLLRRAGGGDQAALGELFAQYRGQLRRMVRLRLDRRLQGRIDPSDVLQEAFLDVSQRAPEYAANPTMPVYLWLRFLTGQRLMADPHRAEIRGQRQARRLGRWFDHPDE